MGRGSYLGGSTIIGPHTPGWFSYGTGKKKNSKKKKRSKKKKNRKSILLGRKAADIIIIPHASEGGSCDVSKKKSSEKKKSRKPIPLGHKASDTGLAPKRSKNPIAIQDVSLLDPRCVRRAILTCNGHLLENAKEMIDDKVANIYRNWITQKNSPFRYNSQKMRIQFSWKKAIAIAKGMLRIDGWTPDMKNPSDSDREILKKIFFHSWRYLSAKEPVIPKEKILFK